MTMQRRVLFLQLSSRKLFDNNKRFFTEDKKDKVIDAIVCVEEAQNVLVG